MSAITYVTYLALAGYAWGGVTGLDYRCRPITTSIGASGFRVSLPLVIEAEGIVASKPALFSADHSNPATLRFPIVELGSVTATNMPNTVLSLSSPRVTSHLAPRNMAISCPSIMLISGSPEYPNIRTRCPANGSRADISCLDCAALSERPASLAARRSVSRRPQQPPCSGVLSFRQNTVAVGRRHHWPCARIGTLQTRPRR